MKFTKHSKSEILIKDGKLERIMSLDEIESEIALNRRNRLKMIERRWNEKEAELQIFETAYTELNKILDEAKKLELESQQSMQKKNSDREALISDEERAAAIEILYGEGSRKDI